MTIEGVLADVCAGSSLDRILPRSALDQLLREWSQRTYASPGSRDFGTHLSNLDLLSIYWSLPVGTARRWAALCSQWLQDPMIAVEVKTNSGTRHTDSRDAR